MNGLFSELDAAISLTTILLGLIAVAALWLMRDTERRLRLFYSAIFGVLIACAAVYFWASLLLKNGELIAAGYMNLAINVFGSLLAPMLAAYVLLVCGERLRGSWLMIAEGALCLAQIVIVLFFHDPVDTLEMVGNLVSPLSEAVFIAMYIPMAVFLILRRRKLKMRTFALLLWSLFASVFLQTLIFELLLMLELAERYFRQKDELARQRINTSVLQMRPHFIYNTMMCIYYLCEQDPKKAQQVTLDFTQYLRRNFTAVAQEGAVPFSEELEHTRAYLAVEQARHEELLSVAFDTPVTLFKLPPLTVQPIVENAIKHAMREDAMLHVTVATAERPGGFAVTVEDDGPGFEPSDDEPHLALDNIRERLRTMCNGTLTIEPREGGGTKVTVFVPVKKAE